MGRTFCYSRPKKDAPETLLSYLCAKFSYFTAEQWAEQIRCGHLRVESKRKTLLRKKMKHQQKDNNIVIADENTNGALPAKPTVPEQILEQGDMICYDPPRQLEPEVDTTHLEVLYEDATSVVVVKNGCLPVTEGGRYCHNTLIHTLNGMPSLKPLYTDGTVVVPEKSDSVLSATASADDLDLKKRGRHEDSSLRFWSVHRLDKETSGVLLVAKDPQTAAVYAQQFMSQSENTVSGEDCTDLLTGASANQDGDVHICQTGEAQSKMKKSIAQKDVCKTYYAVLSGAAPVGTAPQYRISYNVGLLWEDEANRSSIHERLKKLKMAAYPSGSPYGKSACTFITVLASDPALHVSFARISLLTGRTHQIRVHCAALGYPVLGDKLYTTGTPGVPGGAFAVEDAVYLARAQDKEKQVFLPDHLHRAWRCRRHLLHAGALAFTHAVTHERLCFSSLCTPWFLRDVRGASEADEAQLSALLATGYIKGERDKDTL